MTTSRSVAISPHVFERTWVYLVDLLGSSDPAILLEHELVHFDPSEQEAQADYGPHDVAITPNGSLAIVAADNAVGVYNLTTHAFLSRHIQPYNDWRLRDYPQIVDSIEATDTRFVATAVDNVYLSSPPNDTKLWTAEIYALPPSGASMTPLQSYKLRPLSPGSPPTYTTPSGSQQIVVDAPHDLAIDGQAGMAVLSTRYFNAVLTDLASPDASDLILLYRGNNVTGFGVDNANSYLGTTTFVSDSALIAPPFMRPPPQSGIHHYALSLGARLSSAGKPIEARVDVIDLALSSPALIHTFTVTDVVGSEYTHPADFRLGPGTQGVVLRNNAFPDDPPPTLPGGRDFVRFDLATLTEIARMGGSGSVGAVDSMEIRRSGAVSVGESPASFTGHVHLVIVQ